MSKWTRNEVVYLMNHYNKDMSSKEIATALDRTKGSVIGKARRLGVNGKNPVLWLDEEVEFILSVYDDAPHAWDYAVNFLGIDEKVLVNKIAEERKIAHENIQDYFDRHRGGE